MDERISPLTIIAHLKTEPIQLVCWHKVKEFDIYYTIWYQTEQPLFEGPQALFEVHMEISVWDGRGNETAHEILDEAKLVARLTEILSEGQIQSMGFSPYERE